ncbi:MAG TPA: DNA-processing protein DprA [Candidatus Binatia bacterium]|nr:DNA-processing protein DprA [Candidatus Binatia bacterium]
MTKGHEILSEDGHVVLALCSGLGLKDPSGAPDDLAPLKLSEWNEVEKQLQSAGLTPSKAFAGRSATEIASSLKVAVGEAERLARLADRGGRLALELERLFSAGLWAVTRVDETYPARLAKALKQHAPSVLFGAGDIQLLARAGVAVVGSRNIDETGVRFAKEIGGKAARSRLSVVSGGAKGTDRLAMEGALEADGVAVGAMADSLERTVRQPDVRQFIIEDRLALVTPYSPSAGFSVGAAMGRNKLIYGLADYAIVVSSEFQSGGTWAGATEALKAGWCPVFVRTADSAPQGNRELVKLGAVSLPETELSEITDLRAWLQEHTTCSPQQADLFS